MKRAIITLLLVAATAATTWSQVYKFTAISLNYKVYNEDHDYWTDWMGWTPCDIEVQMDASRGNIKIFAKRYQSYNIMYEEESGVFDGNEITSLYCVDQDGVACRIKLVNRKEGQSEIYVEYKDIKWVYSLLQSRGS